VVDIQTWISLGEWFLTSSSQPVIATPIVSPRKNLSTDCMLGVSSLEYSICVWTAEQMISGEVEVAHEASPPVYCT
jgi:hypothetical protein